LTFSAPADYVQSMLRGLVAASLLSGCSLALNWDTPPDAAPDAPPDAPYEQAECDYKEPNDSAAAAAPIVVGDTGPAAICAGETSDFYKFTVPDGATAFTVRLMFMNRPTGDIDLRLYTGDGSGMLAQSRGFGDMEQIVCPGTSPICAPAAIPGDYIFEAFPALPDSVNRYTFAVEVVGP
jgi:hypothetical protein